jgi:hypothetical protein
VDDSPTPGKPCTGPLCLGRLRPLAAFGLATANRDRLQSWCRDCFHANDQARSDAARAAVFAHYGTSCSCPGCGTTENLQIDHVNGGGDAHRRRVRRYGHAFWRWLVEQGFPPEYQTHCQPCNISKGAGPACRRDHSAPPGWKRCTGTCGPDGIGRTLPLTAFYLRPDGTGDGHESQCKDCKNAKIRARRAAARG